MSRSWETDREKLTNSQAQSTKPRSWETDRENLTVAKANALRNIDVLDTVQPKAKNELGPAIEPEPIFSMTMSDASKERLASKEQQAAKEEQRRLRIPDIREVRRARQMYDEARQMNKDATAEKKALDELAAKYGIDPNSNLLSMWLKNTGRTIVNTAGTLLDAANQGMAYQVDPTMLAIDVASGKVKEEGYKAPTKTVYGENEANYYKEKYYDVADELKAKADKEYSDITQGRSKGGKLAVDLANQGLNLLSDTLVSKIIPGAGLANLAVRSFGSSTQEARQAGADTAQQLAYGAATTLTEVLTEKLGGAFAKAYGKTASADLVNYVAGKLAKTDAGQTALTLLFKSLGEGGEEVISDGLTPFFKSIYNGKTGWENFKELDAGDVAYDFLVGSILGFFGEGANIAANSGEASKVEKFFRQAAADGNTFKEACTAWTIYEEAIAPNEADFNANIKPQIEAQKAADESADAAVPTVEAALANGRVNATTAKDIVNDSAKRSAFTQITGIPVSGTKAEQVKTVQREARNFAYEQVLARQEEMRAEAEARAQAQTAAENEAVRNSGYDSYVRGMYNSGKITTADATEIANSAELRATWESMTGKTLPENSKSAVKMIMQTDVNTAKVNLNDPLAFLFEDNTPQQNAQNDAQAQEAPAQQITPETAQNTAEAANEALNSQQAENADVPMPNAPTTASMAAETGTPQRTALLMNDAEGIGESARGDVVSLAQPQTVPQTATDESGFTGRVVETQNTQYQNAGEEQTYHVQHADSDVDARANAFMAGKTTEQVISELESKASWNDVDTDVAGILSERMINEANNAQTEDEATAIRTQLASFRDTLEKKVGDIGRALRQRGRFTNSPAEIVAEATQELYGEGVKTKRTLNKIGKDAVIRNVNDYAGKLANIAEGDTASLVELIHAVSATRRTTGALWAETDTEIIDKALNAAAKMEGGEQFLRDLATAQIKSIASDYVNPGFINQAKAVRYLNMLSNPATSARNFSANTVFGDFISSTANNIALPFDKLLSNASGKRTVGRDKGVFSKDFWNGASEATIKSFLEVTLDAELDNVSYGYNEVKGNTFKMTGNWFERYLATVSKYQGYALKTTDQFQKGGTKSEITRGLAKAGVDAETAGELAQNEADYRTLQGKGFISKKFSEAKKWANDFKIKIGDEKTGTYGLGDSLLPFAEVPSNSVATVLGQNPAAVLPALTNYVKTYADIASGKQVSAETQAKASKAMGRAINGMGLVVLSGIAAAKGLLRNSDDDDKDISGLEKALGRTGMQWNVSATWRALTGQGADARDDDKWISLGWLPQINSAMIIGDAMYQSYIDDGTLSVGDIASASFDGIVDAFLDLPAVSSISSIVNSWKYSDAENNMGKIRDVLTSYVGREIASFLWPNIGSAIAKGTDSKERDAYTSGTAGGEVIDEILGNIPGLRQTLPPKTDNYGNDIYNEGGILNFLNRTVLPGQITTDKNNDVYKEVLRLADAADNKAVVPDKNAPRKMSFGKDTEEHTLTADERDRFKKTAGDVSEAAFGALMKSDIYETLTDAERAEVGAEINSFAKWVAKKELADSLGYDYGTNAEIERFEMLDTDQELADYFSLRAVAGDAYDSKKFDVLDGILASYGNASDDVKAALDTGSTANLDKIYDAMGVGISSSEWNDAYEEKRAIEEKSKTADQKATEFSNYLDNAGYSKKQKRTLLEQMGFYAQIRGEAEKYDALSVSFDSETAYAVTEAMQGKSTDIDKATAIGGVKDLKTDKDKLKALHAYFPAGSDGKEKAIYRRYTAAVEAGFSYDDWTKVEKAAKDKNKTEKINLIMTTLGADKQTATKIYNAGW